MCPLTPTEPEPGSGTFAQGNLHARGRNQLVAVNTVTARLRVWFLQRGVLYGLTQTPMIALIVGFIFKWTTYPLATTFTVLPCLMLLPVWILYRRRSPVTLTSPRTGSPSWLCGRCSQSLHSTWHAYRCTTPSATCSGEHGSASAAR